MRASSTRCLFGNLLFVLAFDQLKGERTSGDSARPFPVLIFEKTEILFRQTLPNMSIIKRAARAALLIRNRCLNILSKPLLAWLPY